MTGTGDAAFASAAANFYPNLAFVLGVPGSGKSTACATLRDSFGYTPLSLDGLITAEVESGSRFGADIAAVVKKGDQLPLDWVVRLLKDAMAADPTGYV